MRDRLFPFSRAFAQAGVSLPLQISVVFERLFILNQLCSVAVAYRLFWATFKQGPLMGIVGSVFFKFADGFVDGF